MQQPIDANLDDKDWALLETLSKEGDISNKDLAQKVGLSPSSCWQRVQRLENDGIIIGYETILDQARLGAPDVVFVVITLERHSGTSPEELIDDLSKFPEILEIYLTSGSSDYLLKVAVEGTRGFEHFVRRRLHKYGGIRQSRSGFSLKCLKRVQNYLPRHDEAD